VSEGLPAAFGRTITHQLHGLHHGRSHVAPRED